LHDFSQRRELSLHAEVAAGVTSALGSIEVPAIVVGAFARDLHLHYGAEVPIQRFTQDIDFAFAVRAGMSSMPCDKGCSNPARFRVLRERSIDSAIATR
jgi:hypothetical protein